MPIYGFDKQTALQLKKLAKQAESQPTNRKSPMGVAYDTTGQGLTAEIPRRKLSNLRGYVVTPKTTIPGAKRVRIPGSAGQVGTLRLGKGTAYIWHRDQDTGAGLDLKLRRDDQGDPVEVTVWNLCPESIAPVGSAEEIDPEDPVLFVTQDQFGDLYVVEKCVDEGSASSSSVGSSISEPPSSAPPSSAGSSEAPSSQGSVSQASVSQGSLSVSVVSQSGSFSGSLSQASVSVSQASVSVSQASGSLSGSLSVSGSPGSVSGSPGSVSTSQASGSLSVSQVGSVSFSVGSLSVSVSPLSFSQVSTSVIPSTSGACCELEVVTDVTFDPVGCAINVTKETINYVPCGPDPCPVQGA